MKVRQKCRSAGPTTGCFLKKETCIEEKQRVRQTSVRNIQKSKQKTKTYICVYNTHIHTSMNVCSGATQRHTRHHRSSSTVPSKQPRETRILTQAMKARKKCRVASPITGCCSKKAPCIETTQRVRQTSVRYTQK
jgi:hypothetical protein